MNEQFYQMFHLETSMENLVLERYWGYPYLIPWEMTNTQRRSYTFKVLSDDPRRLEKPRVYGKEGSYIPSQTQRMISWGSCHRKIPLAGGREQRHVYGVVQQKRKVTKANPPADTASSLFSFHCTVSISLKYHTYCEAALFKFSAWRYVGESSRDIKAVVDPQNLKVLWGMCAWGCEAKPC